MSLLGKFQKQPAEVEKYAIQFVAALAPTDELVNCGVKGFVGKGILRVSPPESYTVPMEVDTLLVCAKETVVLSSMPVAGARIFISNINAFSPVLVLSQTFPISFEVIDVDGTAQTYSRSMVDSYTLLANETAEFVFDGGVWRESFYVRANLVTQAGDQRVRYLVGGGENLSTYTVETTVFTSEGRVLQDEFQVKIKEV